METTMGDRETVLVTGAGGSVGSATCEELLRIGCSVIALDCDDTALHDLEARIACMSAWAARTRFVLHDVRERFPRLARARVHGAIHAAAIKHVGIAERFPEYAERTNVLGTKRAFEFAALHDAKFVLVSSDKAARAKCAMGRTKREAEEYVLDAGRGDAWRCAVRFGNVWWSRGSVLPTWDIHRAGRAPIPCARGNVTRFGIAARRAAETVAGCLRASFRIPSGSIVVPREMKAWSLADLSRAYLVERAPCEIAWKKMGAAESAHEILGRKSDVLWTVEGEPFRGALASDRAPRYTEEELRRIARGLEPRRP